MFQERASAVYAPADESITIAATSEFEGIVVSTPASAAGSPARVSPEDIRVNARGRGNYAREVHDIFVTDSARAADHGGRDVQSRRATGAATRRTSTTARDGEPVLEEVYYFRIDPPQGFGQQMLYTADGEMRRRTSFATATRCCCRTAIIRCRRRPGYRLYYLWAMAGAERKLALHEDPDAHMDS